jgi:hypothetical protein
MSETERKYLGQMERRDSEYFTLLADSIFRGRKDRSAILIILDSFFLS